MNSTDLLLAAEVLKRAETLRVGASMKFLATERRNGSQPPPDEVLRARFADEHPLQEFLEKATKELEDVAQFMAQRPGT